MWINRMSTPRDRDGTWYLISDDADCAHEPIVRLGADNGNNEYFQCEACDTVLIKEGYVDHREIRQQRQQHEDTPSNPLAKAIDVGELMGSDNRGHSSPYQTSQSSTVITRIKRISRRLFKK